MSSLQSGYEELGAEQLERLQQDINNIKNNYKRANVSDNNEQENIKMLWFWLFCFYYIASYMATVNTAVFSTWVLSF